MDRYYSSQCPDFAIAVALDGTVIHKSGLITGGRSTRDSTKKWDETDVKGMFARPIRESCLKRILQGLNRRKEAIHTKLADLQSQKSREKTDETLILEIERLKSSLALARDDLVGSLDPCNSLWF